MTIERARFVGHDRRLACLCATAALLMSAVARADANSASHGLEEMDWGWGSLVLSELLEYAPVNSEEQPVRYELVGWVGGAWNRVWVKAEGEQETRSTSGGTELQLLYGRLISPFWDAQVGLRLDARYGEAGRAVRPLMAIALEGLAPGWFEVEPSVFVGFDGDVSANLTVSYDLLLTQRLVLQPRFEADAAVQEDPEFQVGSGLNQIETGLRLRYEFWREFAPYLGLTWERRFGETADFARSGGGAVGELLVVGGVRIWR